MSPFCIILELRMMEVVVTTGAIRRAKLQSDCHYQQTNIQFFTCQMPFLPPNQHCQSTLYTLSQKWTPMILQNNLTKTGRLSIILTKRIVIQLPGLWLKNLVWVENHLRGIHSNTAPLRTTAKCSRARLTFFFVRKHLTSLFTTVIAAKHSRSLSCRLQDGSCW